MPLTMDSQGITWGMTLPNYASNIGFPRQYMGDDIA